MEENEKFEKFVAKLMERVDKVNEILKAEGKGRRIYPHEAEKLTNLLKYYLENQEKIKKELEEPLEAYREIYEKFYDDEYNFEIASKEKEINDNYDSAYLDENDEIVKRVNFLINGVGICYTYDGSTLTFGLWWMKTEIGPVELARIAVNIRLQFKDEEELKNLVEKVVRRLIDYSD